MTDTLSEVILLFCNNTARQKTIYPNLILIIEEEHILLMRGDKRFKDPPTVEQKVDEI